LDDNPSTNGAATFNSNSNPGSNADEISDGESTDTAIADDLTNPLGTSSGVQVGLYDADSDTLIQTIQDGDVIQSSSLPSQNLTIAALVPNNNLLANQVESITLTLNNQVSKIESLAPYALFGDVGGNFLAGNVPQGNNTITLKLHDQNGGKGQLLETVAVDFSIV
ncbi:MAG: hypothetical protein AAFU78_23025, partial [Cyanobacteria bacterium J06633_2]